MAKPTYEELEQQINELKVKAEKTAGNIKEIYSIVELTPDAVTIHDRGKIVFANKAFADFVGLKGADDVIGKTLFDFSPSDQDFKEATKQHKKDIQENRVESMSEIPVMRNNGTLVFAEVSSAEIIYEGKKVILNIHRDISKRKHAEEMLAESKRMYEDLFENASDLIQSIDIEGGFIHVNKKWHETLGYDRDELKDITVWDIIHPDSVKHCKGVFSKIKSGESTDQIEVDFVSKKGELIPVEGNINCRFEEGQPTATRGIFRDVRKRKKVEDELQESLENTKDANRKLEVAYSQMRAWKDQLGTQLQKDENDFLLNEEGQIIGINDHALESIGLSRLEVIGSDIYDLLEDDDSIQKLKTDIIETSRGITQKVSVCLKGTRPGSSLCEGKIMRIVSKKSRMFYLSLRLVS